MSTQKDSLNKNDRTFHVGEDYSCQESGQQFTDEGNLSRHQKARVRMAQFSQNFPGHGPPKPCPLCGTHLDAQSMIFQCSKVKEKLQIREKYENIFKPEVSNELAKVLQTIVEMRQTE